MAVVGGAIQTIFAGFAFAGAGTLMHYLEPNKFEEEAKRHNLALEKLAVAKEKWYENEVAKKDEVQRLRQQLSIANNDINATNHALDMLRQVQTIQYGGRTFSKEPQMNDYYQPSSDMKKYQSVFIVGAGLVGGVVLAKFII